MRSWGCGISAPHLKRGRGQELPILAGWTRVRPRLKPGPQESLRSALQASWAPATPGDEDLERDGEGDEEEEDEDEVDSLTSGSQVSCPLVWSSVNQAGVPGQGEGRDPNLLLQKPPAGRAAPAVSPIRAAGSSWPSLVRSPGVMVLLSWA